MNDGDGFNTRSWNQWLALIQGTSGRQRLFRERGKLERAPVIHNLTGTSSCDIGVTLGDTRGNGVSVKRQGATGTALSTGEFASVGYLDPGPQIPGRCT